MTGFIFIILIVAVIILSELNHQKKLELDNIEFRNMIFHYKDYYRDFSLMELKKHFNELDNKYSKNKKLVMALDKIPYFWKGHYYSDLDDVDNVIANIDLELICNLIVISDLINQKEQSDKHFCSKKRFKELYSNKKINSDIYMLVNAIINDNQSDYFKFNVILNDYIGLPSYCFNITIKHNKIKYAEDIIESYTLLYSEIDIDQLLETQDFELYKLLIDSFKEMSDISAQYYSGDADEFLDKIEDALYYRSDINFDNIDFFYNNLLHEYRNMCDGLMLYDICNKNNLYLVQFILNNYDFTFIDSNFILDKVNSNSKINTEIKKVINDKFSNEII